MQMTYETDRLILKVLQENAAEQVLDFYIANKNFFEPYEPTRISGFYTLPFQSVTLRYEFDQILHGKLIRYWIFLKEQPEQLIGTLSFHNILRGAFLTCTLGYKMDQKHTCQGYMTEALNQAMYIIFNDCGLHRIEAYVHPNNNPSIALMEKLHFSREGLAKKAILLQGRWEDHWLYAFTN